MGKEKKIKKTITTKCPHLGAKVPPPPQKKGSKDDQTLPLLHFQYYVGMIKEQKRADPTFVYFPPHSNMKLTPRLPESGP